MEPLTKKPKEIKVPEKYKAIDFALSGQPQFPSTPKAAEKIWTDFLNQQAAKGLRFVATFPYALGAEHNRRMVVFEDETTTV